MGRLVATTRTPNHVYILNEVKEEKCCVGQIYESLLWNRIMGHMSFENLVKVSKKKALRDMLKIKKLQIQFASNVNMGRKQK